MPTKKSRKGSLLRSVFFGGPSWDSHQQGKTGLEAWPQYPKTWKVLGTLDRITTMSQQHNMFHLRNSWDAQHRIYHGHGGHDRLHLNGLATECFFSHGTGSSWKTHCLTGMMHSSSKNVGS